MKAIETQYKGYRFRSRLEARWAVFFDALGIEWEYEPEGYDLGEAGWYLPDFFINLGNDHQVWFEVKGKKATKTELDKMQALCDLTNTHGFVASGTMFTPEAEFKKKDQRKAFKIEGAKIFGRTPHTKKEFTKSNDSFDKYAECFGNSCLCGFYEDPDGKVFIDHLYIEDTDKCFKIEEESLPSILKGEGFAVVDVENLRKPGGVSITRKVLEDLTIKRSFNIGKGRFYRSKRLVRAYNKARSARFEHGESP